ncbi:MAG TPA: amino acid ABC transporter permease [Albidovulum sp.]|uniref:amino acid ABC transporter permease n=1 Tax=Albidovulum sp. TaxID=1872424 RepID=UPI002C771DB9|nr:amino acid ABC transporter permease [Albidovulum sp.]
MTNTSVAFARTEMLPQQEPPVSQRGAVKWLRENLFSGPLNTVLTLAGILAVFMIIKASLPWFLNGVWTANSLGECRQIVAANAGPDAHGACWAMIRERWHQFIFGFYPMDQYWRPVLAFALMIVALAPVLYYGLRRINMLMIGVVGVFMVLALVAVGTDAAHLILAAGVLAAIFAVAATAPTKLVWITLLFPAIGFFLLWGGSVWGPIGAVAGFAIFGAVFSLLQKKLGVVVAAGFGLVVAAVWWLWVQTQVTTKLHEYVPAGLPAVDSDQFGGFLLAFVIGVTAIAASLPIGILLALGRRSDMFLVKTLSVGFIEFIRGVPLITMLFVASLLLQYFLPPQTNFDLILRVIILVTLFASAYIAEVIRGGLAALPRGQYEAADALGLDYWQAQRLIIMPQALKISIPGIVSSFIGLFKDTTLVALVGLADPLQGITKIVRADINWKGIYWEPFLFVGVIFFIVCFSMSRYSMYLERKLKRDHR